MKRLLVLVAACLCAFPALAQFPSKPIRVVAVPGGLGDRHHHAHPRRTVSAAGGQPVVVG
jgi:hypothetical protein